MKVFINLPTLLPFVNFITQNVAGFIQTTLTPFLFLDTQIIPHLLAALLNTLKTRLLLGDSRLQSNVLLLEVLRRLTVLLDFIPQTLFLCNHSPALSIYRISWSFYPVIYIYAI